MRRVPLPQHASPWPDHQRSAPASPGQQRPWLLDAALCSAVVICIFAALTWRATHLEAPPADSDAVRDWALARVGARTMPSEVRFLTFEPWNGGWNNRRMSLEIAFCLARLLNRTLVLPPKLSKLNQVQGQSGYEDFFSIQRMREFVPTLTWAEFAPLLKSITPSKGAQQQPAAACQKYKYRQARAFCEASKELRSKARVVGWGGIDGSTLGVVIPVPFSAAERRMLNVTDWNLFRGVRTSRGAMLAEADRDDSLIHFPQNLFGLFYTIFYHVDAAERAVQLRAVRDAFRLRLSVTAPAALAADALRKRTGDFAAVHYRWGDFKGQFDHALVAPQQMARSLRPHLDPDTPVYVASDEADPQVWDTIRAELAPHRVFRLADVMELLGDRAPAPHMHGVLEMLICSAADVFVGTKFSTFSAYITRLRGYSAAGRSKEIYFTDSNYSRREPTRAREARPYSWAGRGASRLGDWRGYRPFWCREYPEAWEAA